MKQTYPVPHLIVVMFQSQQRRRQTCRVHVPAFHTNALQMHQPRQRCILRFGWTADQLRAGGCRERGPPPCHVSHTDAAVTPCHRFDDARYRGCSRRSTVASRGLSACSSANDVAGLPASNATSGDTASAPAAALFAARLAWLCRRRRRTALPAAADDIMVLLVVNMRALQW